MKRNGTEFRPNVEGFIVWLTRSGGDISVPPSADERRQAKLPEHQQELSAIERERLAAEKVNPPPPHPDQAIYDQIDALNEVEFFQLRDRTRAWMGTRAEYQSMLPVVAKIPGDKRSPSWLAFMVAFIRHQQQGGGR
jgi:hypothetical protein